MHRTRSLTAAVLTGLVLAGLVLAGTVGTATAEDGPPSPSPEPTTTAATAEENQPPVAVADEATVAPGGSTPLHVLANDTDDGLGRPEAEAPRLEVVAVRSQAADRFTFTAADVSFAARAGDDGTFEADYDVSDGELTSTAHITVHVTPTGTRKVTLSLPEKPAALKRYTISGKVEPPADGRAVVRVQRRTADGWVGYAMDSTDVDGRYEVGFRSSKPGRRTFRAIASWADGPRAESAPGTLQVHAVADPEVSGPLTPAHVPHSWRAGCPVPPAQLRKIHINRITYTGHVARGVLVVRAGEARDVVRVLSNALDARFPIRLIKPSDHFYDGGRRTPTESDKAAMRAGNTSAFNCRPVTGNPYRVSQHSYGNAIDINTIENPYVTGSTVYPSGSHTYLDRSLYRRGMILRGGVVADTMRNLGWLWGARWSHPDYQHFSSNGG